MTMRHVGADIQILDRKFWNVELHSAKIRHIGVSKGYMGKILKCGNKFCKNQTCVSHGYVSGWVSKKNYKNLGDAHQFIL